MVGDRQALFPELPVSHQVRRPPASFAVKAECGVMPVIVIAFYADEAVPGGRGEWTGVAGSLMRSIRGKVLAVSSRPSRYRWRTTAASSPHLGCKTGKAPTGPDDGPRRRSGTRRGTVTQPRSPAESVVAATIVGKNRLGHPGARWWCSSWQSECASRWWMEAERHLSRQTSP